MKRPRALNPAILKVGFVFLVFIDIACNSVDNSYLQKPVLSVNSQNMTAQEFSDRLSKKLRNYDAVNAKNQDILASSKEEVLREFLINTLTEQWAKKSGLKVTQAEVEAEINKIRSTYPDDLAFRRALTSENISMDAWRSDLTNTLYQKKVAQKLLEKVSPPTDTEIKAYYKAHLDDFKVSERAHLKQIVLDREENAELVLQELKKGGKFEDLAKKFSIAPDAHEGGDAGWIEKGTLEVFDKAFTLSPGHRSAVLKSPYGYHIITLIKKSPARRLSFDEAKDNIRALQLRQREQTAYKAWLDTQVRAAKVQKDDALIGAIQVETRGDN